MDKLGNQSFNNNKSNNQNLKNQNFTYDPKYNGTFGTFTKNAMFYFETTVQKGLSDFIKDPLPINNPFEQKKDLQIERAKVEARTNTFKEALGLNTTKKLNIIS